MPKLRKPDTSDIFGGRLKYVELACMTKGQAKRKLRAAGCGPLREDRTSYSPELVQKDGRGRPFGRAYRMASGWVVHLAKK
ncbi:hypothetical protein LAh2_18 [Aeromonas phage LAh2]|nr:hypothetical protein LAh2_18 [Aeromonas phage LAh2]QDH46368.1 hypothetical protein LAh3_21 [Aeromonas phage LAh3]QDH46418.1 hypothetical protein LAh4_23 [Aeromonas phage LAh4]QDH46471.1 hypothetical protein LAh5_24 [Aeromonas phage LAh5]